MKLKNYFAVVSSFMFVCTSGQAAYYPIGSGGYVDTLPAGQISVTNSNNQPVYPQVTTSFTKPPQTNDWWSSLIWKFYPGSVYSENMFAHPLCYKAQAGGLEIGYPTNVNITPFNPVADGHKVQEYHYSYTKDLTVGVVGLNTSSTKVNNYSDWAVTASWTDASRSLLATIGHGIPFVYLTKTGGNASVNVVATPNIWSNSNGVIGLTVNGHHYGIFGPAGSQWTQTGTLLQSNLNNKNYFSIALLPDNQASTLEFFRQHAYAFITDTTVEWTYDQNNSVVNVDYKATTVLQEAGPSNSNVNRPLMALYRYQWLNSKTPVLGFTYTSPRGQMKVVDAAQFTVNYPYTGSLPFLPGVAQNGVDGYNTNQLYGYIDGIYKQSVAQRWQGYGNGTDTYWAGKNLQRIADLIPIADQVQHGAARDLFLSEVKTRLQNWFAGKNGQVFYYDNNWKTLIGYPASYGSNNQLNDHHFHYGYFIVAASIVANYDPSWASDGNWGGMVDLLIKDVSNIDRSDNRFPILRNFDAYAGHSWANGGAIFGAGNNQESSSEERNYINGLIQWGALTNDLKIRDLGIFMDACTAASLAQATFDVDNTVFPAGFQPNVLGIVWSDGGSYSTWFGGAVQQLHGINFLPIQPGMLYLAKYPAYLAANQAFMLNNGGANYQGVWRDIQMGIKAMYDPLAAINEFNANQNYKPEEGDSKAHTYHWLHNLNQLGKLDPTITANIPQYAVFTKGAIRNHVAYNPTAASIVAKFSDGVSLTIAPRSIVSSAGSSTGPGPVDPTPTPITYKEEIKEFGEATFNFVPSQATDYVKFNYKINGSAVKTVLMTLNNGTWSFTVTGLNSGDKITYSYIYEDNDKAIQTQSGVHTYIACPNEPPVNPPVDPNPTDNVLADTADYKLTAQMGSGSALLTFAPKKNATFVDIHFKINNGTVNNLRMTNANNVWTYQFNNLKNADQLSFNFTYFFTAGKDSPSYTLTYQAPTTASVAISAAPIESGLVMEDETTTKLWLKLQALTPVVHAHYINEAGELTQNRMHKNGEIWESRISISAQEPISYFFTFDSPEGLQTTDWETQSVKL